MVVDPSMLKRSQALQDMLRIARVMVADGEISDREAQAFRAWLDQHPDLEGVWPVSEILGILRNVLADGHLSDAERTRLKTVLERVAGS